MNTLGSTEKTETSTHDKELQAGKPVLAVDLDGSLLRSDMLHESFWNLAARHFPKAMRAALELKNGKAALKRALSDKARVNVALLPYNQDVLDFIAGWKAEGGRVALVTASDQDHADAIAAHLGVFDEVHGSDGTRNLKGANKAAFLTERFGKGGFAYVGDHAADVDVWAQSSLAVTVNAGADLREKATQVAPEVTHLGEARDYKGAAIRALRPHPVAQEYPRIYPDAARA